MKYMISDITIFPFMEIINSLRNHYRHYKHIFAVFYPFHKINSSRHNNIMAFEIRITMLIHNKDDIDFVTEFPCFWDALQIVWYILSTLQKSLISTFKIIDLIINLKNSLISTNRLISTFNQNRQFYLLLNILVSSLRRFKLLRFKMFLWNGKHLLAYH